MSNLTFAPLLSWENAFKAILVAETSDRNLASPWLQENEECYWLSRSAWSFYLIAKFRMRVMKKKTITVWFPDYFCNASIAPLRTLDVTLKFFPILKDGNPDLSAFDDLLNEGTPDLIVAVHYFGKPASIKQLSDFSTKNKVWLIEDAAHVLQPIDEIGKYGDFVLYSPHKSLAIPDGGLLISRESGPGKITKAIQEQFNFKQIYNSIIGQGYPAKRMTLKWLVKRLLQQSGVHVNRTGPEFQEGDVVNANVEDFPHPRMSKVSKKLLQLILPALEEESFFRKTNQKKWNVYLEKDVSKTDVIALTGDYIPYLAIFACKNSQTAEFTYCSLQGKRIPVSTWPDLPPEVLLDKKKHNVAIELRQTRFFLPVHSSLNLD
ncbi:MAG: hypothetical protein ACI86H_002308 [bacterium]|jgi:hypothetical protein